MRFTPIAIFIACVAAGPASRPSFSSSALLSLPSPSAWKTPTETATTRPSDWSDAPATRPSITALSTELMAKFPDAAAFKEDAHNVPASGVSNK